MFDETKRLYNSADLRDLLVGALYELQAAAQDFHGCCQSIGLTDAELKELGFEVQ